MDNNDRLVLDLPGAHLEGPVSAAVIDAAVQILAYYRGRLPPAIYHHGTPLTPPQLIPKPIIPEPVKTEPPKDFTPAKNTLVKEEKPKTRPAKPGPSSIKGEALLDKLARVHGFSIKDAAELEGVKDVKGRNKTGALVQFLWTSGRLKQLGFTRKKVNGKLFYERPGRPAQTQRHAVAANPDKTYGPTGEEKLTDYAERLVKKGEQALKQIG